jgi:uncharacterized membrane protein
MMQPSPKQKILHAGAAGSLLALIILGIAWELLLAPLRPGGSWMVLKVLPLLMLLRGVVFRRDVYTMQWSSMLILLYFTEGIVRATSDKLSLSATLGWIEVALTCCYFFCTIFYLRPFKQAAKKQIREALQKNRK